jgi:hypothetical protein
MDWTSRAEEMLHDSESIRETIRIQSGAIVVTSHRVLTFTPDRAGANYRYVDRPNVDAVSISTTGHMGALKHAIKALVIGGVLLAAGATINFDSLVSGVSIDGSTTTGQVGMGGMMGMLQSTLTLLARLDEVLLVVGSLAIVAGLIALGVYLYTRDRVLVISVAGDDDIELTAPTTDSTVTRLQDAIQSSASVPGGPP